MPFHKLENWGPESPSDLSQNQREGKKIILEYELNVNRQTDKQTTKDIARHNIESHYLV